MRYLAIDYGTKRTGLAICDAAETIASPLKVLEGRKNLVERIAGIIRSEKVEAVVLGLPLNMDGSEGHQAKLTREFAAGLKKSIDMPIHLHDERLSSFEAEQKLASIGLSRGKKAERLDAVAAAEILTAFLEDKGRGQSQHETAPDLTSEI